MLILGYLDAHVGRNSDMWGEVLGGHGKSEMNDHDSGLKLLEFCACNELLVIKTWFQHKMIH